MATSPKKTDEQYVERDTNPDAITGEHGSHPVGSGLGAAAGGAATGAAAGAVGGPVGAVVGAVVGGVAGGLAGKAIAEKIDPTVEHGYWKNEYKNRDYVHADHDYDTHYGPAYQYGWESRAKHDGRTFEEVESDLSRDWDQNKKSSALSWEQARPATHDAWNRIDQEHGSGI